MPELAIRPERADDAASIAAIVEAAFGEQGADTARFVRAVRQKAEVCLAEVATLAGAIVGHALWCAAPVRVDGWPVKAAYLCCLSVDPARHGQGIGARLVESGLATLRAHDFQVASLLGDPSYYSRFGFSSRLGQKIRGLHRQKGPGFQAVELVKGALAGATVVSDFPDVIAPPP